MAAAVSKFYIIKTYRHFISKIRYKMASQFHAGAAIASNDTNNKYHTAVLE